MLVSGYLHGRRASHYPHSKLARRTRVCQARPIDSARPLRRARMGERHRAATVAKRTGFDRSHASSVRLAVSIAASHCMQYTCRLAHVPARSLTVHDLGCVLLGVADGIVQRVYPQANLAAIQPVRPCHRARQGPRNAPGRTIKPASIPSRRPVSSLAISLVARRSAQPSPCNSYNGQLLGNWSIFVESSPEPPD